MRSAIKGNGIPTGLSLWLHEGDDLVSNCIRQEGIWDAFETKLVTDHLAAGQVFVDVGANIGYYTLIAAAIVGEHGLVYAIEPERGNVRLLDLNCRGLSQVRIAAVCFADQTGQEQISLSPDNLGDHRLYPGPGRKEQVVEVLPGDRLKYGRRVDFLKIDTQGSETRVIRGLENTLLDNSDHLKMILEFWPWGLQQSGSSARQLVGLIEQLDLDAYVIDHQASRLLPVDYQQLIEAAEGDVLSVEQRGFINLFMVPAGTPV